jgi:hypothetical protein
VSLQVCFSDGVLQFVKAKGDQHACEKAARTLQRTVGRPIPILHENEGSGFLKVMQNVPPSRPIIGILQIVPAGGLFRIGRGSVGY